MFIKVKTQKNAVIRENPYNGIKTSLGDQLTVNLDRVINYRRNGTSIHFDFDKYEAVLSLKDEKAAQGIESLISDNLKKGSNYIEIENGITEFILGY